MAQETITLTLPEPPSANVYYRRGFKGVPHESSEAKVYKQAVEMLTSRHRVDGMLPFPSGDLSVMLVWYRSRKAGDLDNRVKILLDALRGMVYRDDKQIAQLWARRVDEHPTLRKGFMSVEVSAVDHGTAILLPRAPAKRARGPHKDRPTGP